MSVFKVFGLFSALLVSFGGTAEVVDTGDGSYVDRIAYRHPVNIVIPAGVERVLVFQNPVLVGVREHDFKKIRVNTVANSSYWKILKSLDTPLRIKVTDTVTKEIFLFDVTSIADGSSSAPIEVLSTKHSAALPSGENIKSGLSVKKPVGDPYVALTRYVSQRYFAPARLQESLSGVSRIPLKSGVVSALITGGAFTSSTISAWRYRGYILTVVEVKNDSQFSQYLNFDSRYSKEYGLIDIRANYLAVSSNAFQLGKTGAKDDTTLLYLITKRPFLDSIYDYVSWKESGGV